MIMLTQCAHELRTINWWPWEENGGGVKGENELCMPLAQRRKCSRSRYFMVCVCAEPGNEMTLTEILIFSCVMKRVGY